MRMNPWLEWFRLKTWFGYIHIVVSDWSGMNRIKSNQFLTLFHQTRYKTFFGLVRNDSVPFGSNSFPKFSPWISIPTNLMPFHMWWKYENSILWNYRKIISFTSVKFDLTSKIHFFRYCTRFLVRGQKMNFFAQQGAIKYTLWPDSRK